MLPSSLYLVLRMLSTMVAAVEGAQVHLLKLSTSSGPFYSGVSSWGCSWPPSPWPSPWLPSLPARTEWMVSETRPGVDTGVSTPQEQTRNPIQLRWMCVR